MEGASTTHRPYADSLARSVGSLDLKGSVFLDAEFTAPWAISAHVTADDCRPWISEPGRVIAYHIVLEGEFEVFLGEGNKARERRMAKSGDVIFLPSNDTHILASGSGVEPTSGDDLLLPPGDDGLMRIRHGAGGRKTRILCGFMATSDQSLPILEGLPDLLIVSIDQLKTRRWIESSMTMVAGVSDENPIVGQSFVSDLCRLLLIEVLGAHIESRPQHSGWLRGIADPKIGPALELIHREVSDVPRITELARRASMSRSAFVDRFTNLMGLSPRAYLIAHRMQTASNLLRDTELSTSEVAYRVGYSAPEAFSRAFKRETGQSPADWRKRSFDALA